MIKKVSDKIILSAIQNFWSEHKHGPSVGELKLLCGLQSNSTIHARLKRLEKIGLIKNTEKYRSVNLTQEGIALLDAKKSNLLTLLSELAFDSCPSDYGLEDPNRIGATCSNYDVEEILETSKSPEKCLECFKKALED